MAEAAPEPPAWHIRAERPRDAASIEALAILTFGPGRFAKTAYRLREGVAPDPKLGFVAEAAKGEGLLGSVRFWPITVGAQSSLLLGPLVVRPDLRGKGIGIALMQRGIETARALGHKSVILVGDEPYYSRVGFKRIPGASMNFPGPVDRQRLLGLALVEGALETLSGDIARARIDIPVSAQATALGAMG